MRRMLGVGVCVVLLEAMLAGSGQQRPAGPPGRIPPLPPSPPSLAHRFSASSGEVAPQRPSAAKADTFQTLSAPSAHVDVITLDGKSVSVALGDLTRHVVTADDHGNKTRFEGVLLRDVLVKAGAPLGEQLHGPAALTRFVKITARDGYAVVFSIAELDRSFTDEVVVLADVRDGKRLAADAGPLQIVTPHEKRAGRWIRQVSRIEIREAK